MRTHHILSLAVAAGVVAALCFQGLKGVRADEGTGHHGEHYLKCARACADCQLQCDSCFHHCATLLEDGKKDHARSMHTCVDCAECCKLSASLCARQSSFAEPACVCCARCCDECAEACARFPDDKHMADCARACRECAKACRDMVKMLKK